MRTNQTAMLQEDQVVCDNEVQDSLDEVRFTLSKYCMSVLRRSLFFKTSTSYKTTES